MERLSRFGFRFSILLAALSLPNLSPFPPINFWHELNVSLGAYYMVAHALTALLLLITIRSADPRRTCVLALFLQTAMLASYAVVLWPYWYTKYPHAIDAKHSIYYANVYRSNQTPQLIAKQIESLDPDIVALTEYHSDLDALLKLEVRYPFSIRQVREDCFGMVVYSKFPIAANPIVSLGSGLPPEIIASIDIGAGEALTFALTHSIPPLSDEALYKNTLIMRRLAQRMRHAEEPIIVVGDFNATPYSWFYQGFISITNLRDASAGFGLRRTWNAQQWWLWFIIDHVFVNDRIGVQQVQRLESNGSDHYALLMRFEVH